MKRVVYLVKETNHYIKERKDYMWSDMYDMLYGYTFLFDPYILAEIESIPELKTLRQISDWESIDVFISCLGNDLVSRDMEQPLLSGVQRVLRSAHAAVLTQPSSCFWQGLNQLKDKKHLYDIVSLCETWNIHPACCRYSQKYPLNMRFQAVHAGAGRVYSTVGEWPALIVDRNLALFTIDPMRAFLRWNRGNFTYKHAGLWVFLLLTLLENKTVATIDLEQEIEIRRDFHAYGYALVMLKELAALQKKNIDDCLRSANEMVLKAARDYVRGDYGEAQDGLRQAFHELYKGRLKITSLNIRLVDGLHASTLNKDYGCAEMEWPQWTAEMMAIFFNWIDQRNYRACLDWDVRSLESLAERNPVLTSKLRRYLSENKIEVINGGYTQHYPHYWSPQATIQNLKHGREVFKKIFGQTVATFGGQECCMNPQMPNFLGKSGYQYALHRIQNFGHVPLVKENLMSWKGRDGTLIKAIPGNPSASERTGSIFYLLLAFKIHQSIAMGIKDPVLTNLQDIGNVAFREEVCRIAFYAPLFGRHSTIKDCFTGKGQLPVKSFDYYDYQYGYIYAGSARGDENDDFTRAFRLERVLTDAQLVNGLAAFNQKSNPRTWRPYWDLLFAFQSHDVLIASDACMGSFFPDMGGPLDFSLKRNTRLRPVGERFIHNCRNYIHQTLQKTRQSKGEGHGIFNTLGFARRVQVRDRQGQSGSINVPAWGVASRLEPLEGDIAVTKHTVENRFIRLNINPKSGFIQGVIDKQTGQEVIRRCNEFVYGKDSVMRMDNCQLVEHTSWNARLSVSGAITLKKDVISWYATDITLNAQSRLINCRARFYPVIAMPANPCDHAIHQRLWMTAKRPEVITSYLNINAPLREGAIHRQFKRFKPYIFPLFVRPSDPKLKMFDSPWYVRLVSAGNTVDLYNNGPQWYYLKGNTIRQHLVAGKEACLEYHYAIAVNNTVRHPLLSSLDWQTPVYPVNVEARESWSLFTIVADNLVPFGCEYIGNDTFLFRVMEIEGRKTKSEVLCACPVKEAVETDYLGVPQRTLFKKQNRFICNLPAWGISEFHVRLNNNALPGFSR